VQGVTSHHAEAALVDGSVFAVSTNRKYQLSIASLRSCAGKRGIDNPDVVPG
jgi:hypothetical protein